MKLLQWEFCQIFKETFFKEHLRWLLLKMKTTEPKYCTLHLDWAIVIFEWFVMHYFGSSSKWTCSIASQKSKYGKTKWIISFLYSYKKNQVFSRLSAVWLHPTHPLSYVAATYLWKRWFHYSFLTTKFGIYGPRIKTDLTGSLMSGKNQELA